MGASAGIFASAILVVVFALGLMFWLDLDGLIGPTVSNFDIFWAIVAGLGAGVIIGVITSITPPITMVRPSEWLRRANRGCHHHDSGIATGMQSTVMPVLIIGGRNSGRL